MTLLVKALWKHLKNWLRIYNKYVLYKICFLNPDNLRFHRGLDELILEDLKKL